MNLAALFGDERRLDPGPISRTPTPAQVRQRAREASINTRSSGS